MLILHYVSTLMIKLAVLEESKIRSKSLCIIKKLLIGSAFARTPYYTIFFQKHCR